MHKYIMVLEMTSTNHGTNPQQRVFKPVLKQRKVEAPLAYGEGFFESFHEAYTAGLAEFGGELPYPHRALSK